MIRVFSVKQELWLCDALDVPTWALRGATGEHQSRNLRNNTGEACR